MRRTPFQWSFQLPQPPQHVPPISEEQQQSSFLQRDMPALSANAFPALSDNPLAAVIRAFPWTNGITLLHGSMADTLQSLWDSNGGAETEMHNSLLLVRDPFRESSPRLRAHRHPQTQAQVLDAFSLRHLVNQDPRIIVFLQRLATVDRHSFFNNGGWSGVSPLALATIAHVLVRLNIFDHFLDALAFPPQAILPILRTVPFPYEFPERVRRVGLFHFRLHFLTDFYLGGSRTPPHVDASDHSTPTHDR